MMQVLIADGATIYYDILQQALGKHPDLTVRHVTSAEEVLTAAAAGPIEFLIISRYLPDGDGLALVRQLREQFSLDLLPIVLLTGSASDDLAREAENAGVTEIFRKQDIEELISFLQRFLAVHAELHGKVMYIEDSLDQRMALEAQLREWGLEIDSFASAEDAWVAYQEKDYDLIISDVVLKGRMTGSRLVNRVRRLPGAKGDVPILALTAFDSPRKRIKLFHLGVTDYISKPVQEIELHARLHGILGRKLVSDRNRALLDASSLAVLVMDAHGVVLSANCTAADVFRLDNLSGMPLRTLFPKLAEGEETAFLSAHLLPLSRRGETGLPWDGAACRGDGEAFPIRFAVIESTELGSGRHFALLIRDISVEEELAQHLMQARDEAEDASRLKSQFLANMSHEIRTPMNGVLGMMQLALDGDMGERERAYIRKARDSATFMLGVLDDILDFSKIEAGCLQFEAIPFDLANTLLRVEDMFASRALDKGLSLRFARGEDIPNALVGDSLRLAQVLSNLIANAIKFTAKGLVSVAVELIEEDHRTSVGRVKLRFAVSDTGIGLSREDQERIFQPFVQARASTSRQYGGSGLGLVICMRLVEKMGGKLSLVSEPGKGSVFAFTVDFALADPALLGNSQQGEEIHPQLAGRRVLVVEDSPINQEIAVGYLERVGVQTRTADDGAAALHILAATPTAFDAVLMDIQMPVMDGFEAMQAIRDQLGLRDLPVIALTADAMLEHRQRCMAMGMRDYVTKPIDRERLYRVLARCFKEGEPAGPVSDSQAASHAGSGQTPPAGILGDYAAALERMRGDHAMYRRVLQATFLHYDDAALRLGGHLEAGDLTSAHRLAHTLKGVAATLGAGALQASARALETLLRGVLSGEPLDAVRVSSGIAVIAHDLDALRMLARNWPDHA